MTETRNIAVVGAGLIGAKRIRAFPSNWNLVWIVDSDLNRAQTLALEFSSVKATDSLDSMLSDDSIEVVVVATTHSSLTEVAEAALIAGKNVFVEKPGGTNAAALKLLSLIASERGLRVHVGYNHRFHPSIVAAMKLAARPGVGRLMWIRGRYGHGGRLGYESEWRARREISGGGELVDQGSHLIDLCLKFDPDFDAVFADLPTQFWKMDVEDNAFIFLRSSSGSRAMLHASWTEWKNLFNFEVSFERLKLDISGLGGSYGVEKLTAYWMQPEMGPPPSETFEFKADESWALELVDFEQALRGESYVGCDLTGAIRNLEIIGFLYTLSKVQN